MTVSPDLLRALVLDEVERQRPGLNATFMDNATSEGTLVLYSIVERDDPADSRWVFMQFKPPLQGDHPDAFRAEIVDGVHRWLDQYDEEVAEGPTPVEAMV